MAGGIQFQSIEALRGFIRQVVSGCMSADGEIADFVKEGLAERANTDVYETYSPTAYRRRYSLNKPDNIKSESAGMKLIITPESEFNHEGNIEGNTGNLLPGLVNYGSGWNGYYYGWDNVPPPRPYIDNTAEELEGVFPALLADALKKSGFNVR